MPRSILWFRRDLRVSDHLALAAAHAAGDVVPLFVVDPLFTATSGAPRRAFMARALRDLDEQLGGALVYRHGDPVDVVPAVAREVGADTVFVSRDYGPYGRRRDGEIAARLEADGRRLRGEGSPYAVDPGSVSKADGSPYAVFTPFSRQWFEVGAPRWQQRPATPKVAAVQWVGSPDIACDGPPDEPQTSAHLPPTKSSAVHRHWNSFVTDGLDDYAARRNLPAIEGTSRMSPALRWGLVHPCELLDDLGHSRAHDRYRTELAWREFYADVLFHRPESARENLRQPMNAMHVDTDAAARKRFAAWCEGRTGYPIVDAGMRELLGIGWMHNRVRMIVASFLVKDLHLPWQWGARHFMQHLVDGDLASNSHGWQWTAGTGTDAAPYFRIFNPTTQSEKFDPDGDYIRHWVPELADVAAPGVHAPTANRPDGYPAPIVDHATERHEALSRYKSVTSSSR
ncbi:MAG: Deoxyribodipyrimidine photo-lyase [Ilumatobacteraceae bacterium]|nr:Deoxyribodipyrimidine photo-lyase [Ilumatobacteraceae bacterium]